MPLSISPEGKWFDDTIAKGCKEIWETLLREFEHIMGELAVMCALFYDNKTVDPTEFFPELGELSAQEPAEKRADTDVGEVISFASDRSAAAGIVAMLGMIKRLFHEPGERLRTVCADLLANEVGEVGVQWNATSNAEPGFATLRLARGPTFNGRNVEFDAGQ